MKKTLEFKRDLAALRSRFGEKEYGHQEILPAVEALLVQHGIDTLRDAAMQVLNEAERIEDQQQLDQPDMFNYEAHVALGEGRRVKRGCMIFDHLRRRGRVIDKNKAAQDRAWAKEKAWIDEREIALHGYAPTTKVKDVIAEDGTTLRNPVHA